MAKTIGETLKPFLVTLDLVNTRHEEALRETASVLLNRPEVVDFEGFFKDLLQREKMESTCLGHQVAFPHARTDAVKEMVIAAGRSRQGVEFPGISEKVKFIFVIGTPKRMVTEYLAAVGALARLLKEESLRQKLLGAKTPEEFLFHLTEAGGK